MRLLNIVGTSVFQIVSLIFVLAYLVGVLNLYFSDRNDYCIMTYMFEYPQFVVSQNIIKTLWAIYVLKKLNWHMHFSD